MFSQKTIPGENPGTLGETLDILNNQLGRLHTGLKVDGLYVLRLLDHAAARMKEMEDHPNPGTAELAQSEFLFKRLKDEAGLLLKAAGGPEGLRRGREMLPPGSRAAEAWWWHLDQVIASRRRATLVRFLRTAATTAAVLAVLVFVYQNFFAPDEQTRAVLQAEQSSRQFLAENRVQEALASIETGLQAAPQNPELLLLMGAVLTRAGRLDEAAAAFASVESQVPERQIYLLGRGQAFITAGLPQKSLEDARAILALDPQSALAYMLKAQAYMNQDDYRSAVTALEEAARLGDLQKNTPLVAQAKVQQAMIMEMMGGQALNQNLSR